MGNLLGVSGDDSTSMEGIRICFNLFLGGWGGRVNRIGVNVIGWLVALVFYPYFFFIRYVYGLGWGFIPIYSGRILDG